MQQKDYLDEYVINANDLINYSIKPFMQAKVYFVFKKGIGLEKLVFEIDDLGCKISFTSTYGQRFAKSNWIFSKNQPSYNLKIQPLTNQELALCVIVAEEILNKYNLNSAYQNFFMIIPHQIVLYKELRDVTLKLQALQQARTNFLENPREFTLSEIWQLNNNQNKLQSKQSPQQTSETIELCYENIFNNKNNKDLDCQLDDLSILDLQINLLKQKQHQIYGFLQEKTKLVYALTKSKNKHNFLTNRKIEKENNL